MNEVLALVLVLLLATSGYAAGRLHGQFSYRRGFRLGYRQGYFDGDRASWNRRRRDLQAAVASVLNTPPEQRADTFPANAPHGTTYTSATREADDSLEETDDSLEETSDGASEGGAGRPLPGPRPEWALVDAAREV